MNLADPQDKFAFLIFFSYKFSTVISTLEVPVKSFKVLTASLLAPTLFLSSLVSPGVLAQGQLIETVPKFYYLEQSEGGETVHIHACYQRPPRKSNFEEGKAFSDLGWGCNTSVEVAVEDLEAFAQSLSRELSMARVAQRETKMRGQSPATFLGTLFGIFGTTGGIVGVVSAFDGYYGGTKLMDQVTAKGRYVYSVNDLNPAEKRKYLSLKHTYRHSRIISSIAGGAISLAVLLGSIGMANKADQNVFAVAGASKTLLEELRSGMVTGASAKSLRDEILQRFTDFLNEFGRPVN